MAKKGQVQFHIEVNNDEEWEKLLEREGLIIVDVYSDWCGPCAGMQGTLKKIKLEVGGDMLHIAMAKTDGISSLERFRNKSEPTWMFVSQGKMVNLMYGADAPKLTRLILEELQRENERIAGTPRIDEREITDLADEEQIRVDAENAKIEAARLIEEQKKAQQLYEGRLAQAMHILDTYAHIGIILILPRGKPYFTEMMADLWAPAGLNVSNKEKIKLNADMLEEILFFAEGYTFPEDVEQELLTGESMALFLKPANDDVAASVEEVVLQLIYGPSKQHPGSPNSIAQLLIHKVEEAIKESEAEEAAKRAEKGNQEDIPVPSEEENKEIICIWAPPNNLTKAYAFKNFFYTVAAPLIIPEPEPIPPHLAVAFDAFKRRDVLSLMEQYPEAVMRFGFFTSEEPEEAKLIAKNPTNFERKLIESTTHTEKMVLQLSKKRSEAFLAFAQLGPCRISTNVSTGEEECKIFFPEDYDTVEEEIVETTKKTVKKRGKKKQAKEEEEGAEEQPAAATEGQPEIMPEEGEGGEAEGEEREEGEGGEGDEEGEATAEEGVDGADKATSPMPVEVAPTAGGEEPANG